MDKMLEISSVSQNHGISINERKSIYITGVLKIDNFDEEEFLLETNMGYLVIKGTNLEIVRLDTKDGIVSIKGNFISMTYIDELKKANKESSVFNKLSYSFGSITLVKVVWILENKEVSTVPISNTYNTLCFVFLKK